MYIHTRVCCCYYYFYNIVIVVYRLSASVEPNYN